MTAVAVKEFDLWQPGYAGATVTVLRAGTLVPQPIFHDPDGAQPAPNPQPLLELERDGIRYGRFSAPIYVLEDYSLKVTGGGGEAITRVPLSTLDGEPADRATVTAPGATHARTLAGRAGYEINVLDQGDIGESAAANTDLINAAIGIAAAAGGGTVNLPRGAFGIRAIVQIPSNVRLRGHGVNATIMRGAISDDLITLTGSRAAVEGFTLDGVTVPDGSIGIRLGPRLRASDDVPQLTDCTVRDVLVRRFDTGILATYGAQSATVAFAEIAENNTGLMLEAEDGEIADLHFLEARFALNATRGAALVATREHAVSDIYFHECRFEDGPKLLEIEGAQNTLVAACSFRGGAAAGAQGAENLSVADAAGREQDFTDGVLFHACALENVRARFEGVCRNVRFDNSRLEGLVWELRAPDNNILLIDCDESESDRIETIGAANLVRKDHSLSNVSVHGHTTSATPVTAWSYTLKPGEVIFVEALAVGRQTNGENVAAYRAGRTVRLAGATLPFDAGTAGFEVGAVVANKTRSGKARVVGKSGTTAMGTLTLSEITGEFRNNDVIGTPAEDGTVPDQATVNGALSYPQGVVLLGAIPAYQVETLTGWGGVELVANGLAVDVRVAGDAGMNVSWNVQVSLASV